MSLPRYEKSWVTLHGGCGALLSDDIECNRPCGHLVGDLPHQAYSPSGDQWIEYDDSGVVVAEGRSRSRR
jgi:hypothetical protein